MKIRSWTTEVLCFQRVRTEHGKIANAIVRSRYGHATTWFAASRCQKMAGKSKKTAVLKGRGLY
jgi:hypothetical protein